MSKEKETPQQTQSCEISDRKVLNKLNRGETISMFLAIYIYKNIKQQAGFAVNTLEFNYRLVSKCLDVR